MKRDWSYDSPLISKANIVADVFFVNLLYLMCCALIVTIGPASSALIALSDAFLREEACGPSVFWKVFRRNCRDFLLPWLFVLCLGVFLLYDIYLLLVHTTMAYVVFAIILIVLSILYLMVLAHVALIHARFECKFRHLLTNAVLISMAHPLQTLTILLLKLFPWVVFFFFPQVFVLLTPLWLFAYFSLSHFAMAKITFSVYRRISDQNNNNH